MRLQAAPKQPRSRPIFVLGIDRSGTSLLAEVTFRWGAYAGDPKRLASPDEGNPQGYWEYEPMQELVGDLIVAAGVSPWDDSFRDHVRRYAADPTYRDRALSLISEMQAGDRPWFWKEPNFAFLLPFWNELVEDPIYLVTLRNPHHSALSYEKYSLPPILSDRVRLVAYFLLRWQHYMISIAEGLKGTRSKILVSYEALLSSPGEQCARICRFLDAETGGVRTDDESTSTVECMAQTINPRLWRNRPSETLGDVPEASAEQKALFLYLSERLDGDLDDFDASHYPLPPCWREYVSNIGVIRWLLENLE